MAKDLALILCDGGLNACVTTALAAQKYRLIFLNIDAAPPTSPAPGATGKKTAYEALVAHFKPYREHTLPMPFLTWAKKGGPASFAGIDPRLSSDVTPKLLDLLPIIATAYRFAAHYEAVAIHAGLRIGSDGNDLARATEYTQIFSELAQIPCGLSSTDLAFPLLELDPWQVVDLGIQVSAPLEKTWSCDQDSVTPCAVCPACRAREAAFQQAAKPDPLRKK